MHAATSCQNIEAREGRRRGGGVKIVTGEQQTRGGWSEGVVLAADAILDCDQVILLLGELCTDQVILLCHALGELHVYA